MSTIFNNLFSINGVLDTGNPVLQNMQEIASACGCWLTYDINQGKWAVIINRAGSSTSSFNDSNIIGGINISSTGLTEVYNSVEIEFPHKDLQDQKDYIKLSISAGDRYPNEPDNLLSIKTELINDPLQAEMIATRELKQSRVDKVIQFKTDYSKIGIKAGDLIDVTNTAYGFSSKVFRIIQIDEEDADDGTLMFSITALEYDSGIYSTGGLVRSGRERASGITNQSINAYVKANDYAATGTSLANSLNDPNNSALFALLLDALAKKGVTPTVFSFLANAIVVPGYSYTTSDAVFLESDYTAGDYFNTGYSIVVPYTGKYQLKYFYNWGANYNKDGSGNTLLPKNIRKQVEMTIVLNGTQTSINGSSIGKGDDPFADQNLTGFFNATAGQTLNFRFGARSDLTSSSPIEGGGTATGASSFVIVSGDLIYLGKV